MENGWRPVGGDVLQALAARLNVPPEWIASTPHPRRMTLPPSPGYATPGSQIDTHAGFA